MSVSHDGNMLVVSNVTSGFDIYHLNDSSLDGSVLQPSNGMLVPVTFIHEGQAILGGSMCGKVQIWDSTDRSLLGTLIHDGGRRSHVVPPRPTSKREEEAAFNYGMPSRLKTLLLSSQAPEDNDTHGIRQERGVVEIFRAFRWVEIATIIVVSVGAYILGSLVGLPYRAA
ncbi:hypothetical protein EDD15DRAFT_2191402 [Pisolithus albus]|nr:hypothetical protein EDD15DRAFT_2200082 [Pisolithus albus]KAI6006115.1 hypothetical protein EDD15DRAFT_2191402 [Pisolithus albus]